MKRRNKLVWILLAGALCLLLYSIVIMRSDNKTKVILGGVDGAFIESDGLTFVDPNAVVETPEPTVDIWPQLDLDDFDDPQYMIVNADNFLSAAYEPAESAKISGTNWLFDTKGLPYLEQMLQDCRDAGFKIFVTAGYRSYSYQNNLFNRTASIIADGMGLSGKDAYLDPKYQEAAEKAKKEVAFPGTSEHQLGLAVDLMDWNYSYKPSSSVTRRASCCSPAGMNPGITVMSAPKWRLSSWSTVSATKNFTRITTRTSNTADSPAGRRKKDLQYLQAGSILTQ